VGEPLNQLADFGRAIADAQDEEIRRVPLSTEARLLAEPPKVGASRPRRVAMLSLAAAAAATVLALWLWPRAVTFSVGETSTTGELDEWIAAPADRAVPLRFSDGTSLVLAARARARVTGADQHGAKLVVERGRVDATVVPRQGSSWRLLFGPFQVHVTGTRFVADWSPETQRRTVDLSEGSVLVQGPALGGGHALTAGDLLEVSAVEQRASIRSTRPTEEEPAATAEPVLPPADHLPEDAGTPPAEPTDAEALDATPPVRTATVPRWRSLYVAGKYRPALAEAKQQGFESLCAEAGAAELMMLAETARYGGEPALAVQALTSLRKRHAGGSHAAVAAFHLGTMAFDQRGAYGEAARWFATYLAEQPGGALAREAAGRLLEARQRAGDAAGARAAAEQYLKAYPKGPHAESASRLLVD